MPTDETIDDAIDLSTKLEMTARGQSIDVVANAALILLADLITQQTSEPAAIEAEIRKMSVVLLKLARKILADKKPLN